MNYKFPGALNDVSTGSADETVRQNCTYQKHALACTTSLAWSVLLFATSAHALEHMFNDALVKAIAKNNSALVGNVEDVKTAFNIAELELLNPRTKIGKVFKNQFDLKVKYHAMVQADIKTCAETRAFIVANSNNDKVGTYILTSSLNFKGVNIKNIKTALGNQTLRVIEKLDKYVYFELLNFDYEIDHACDNIKDNILSADGLSIRTPIDYTYTRLGFKKEQASNLFSTIEQLDLDNNTKGMLELTLLNLAEEQDDIPNVLAIDNDYANIFSDKLNIMKLLIKKGA